MRTTTLKVLIGTLCLTIIIFIVSFIYYDNINSCEDPRVLRARTLLLEYDKKLEENQTGLALTILNSMHEIYKQTPGYETSYEVGFVLNNIASVYLVKVETDLLTKKENVDTVDMNNSLDNAETYIKRSIEIYKKWIAEMGSLTKEEIKVKISPYFTPDDPALKQAGYQKVLDNRIEDILTAQIETSRRLSVAYANLGVIKRYQGNLDESKKSYETAISLWDKNYTAQDNLNMLMNKPVKKRSIISRLFPPDRKEDS